MRNKPAAGRIIKLILSVVMIFALVNLFWYQFKYKPYKEKTVTMQLNEDSERPRYTCIRNGYAYTVKMPSYLSFQSGYLYVVAESHLDSASFLADDEGNLTEKNVPHVDLFIWPQLFSGAFYRITVFEETESMWIIVNSDGEYIPDETLDEVQQAKAGELYENHKPEIIDILEAAVQLWGNDI
ncbi:MAG: hypothetical protein II126_04845 [Erysipelotrichaceae bacterium]|nr:hypothetical protein [Erysipelotrichaceae bacterium]